MSDTASKRVSKSWLPVGIGVTDASAVVGGVLWLAAVLTTHLGTIQRAIALAVLVVVPLGMGMAATPRFEGRTRALYTAAVLGQPVGAVSVLVSFVLPADGFSRPVAALPWVVVTGLLGLTALLRVRRRGPWPLSETLVDAGFAYSIVAAVALVFHHLGISVWFDPVIILLTAIHFHFAGFVLPVLTGLTGRTLGEHVPTGFRVLAVVVLFGPAFIAVGISFSPVVEVLAVGGFTLAVAILGGYIALRIAPRRSVIQGGLVGMSALALPVSMILALGYGIGTFAGVRFGIDIGTMVALHGSLNAYGFALCGALGWRIAVPRMPAVTT